MAAANVSLDVIQNFLSQKRIAIVGVSRNGRDVGAQLLREFRRQGHEVFAVNPYTSDIAGERCYANVRDIRPAPDAALLITSPADTDSIVRDCAEAGIGYVWMFRGSGHGAVSDTAVDFCREHGIEVIPGQCPFMYLDPVRHVHWVHRLVVKLTGKYPAMTTALRPSSGTRIG